jgi:hypothetical protein
VNLRAEEPEHLALEPLEVAEAVRDDLVHDPVVDAPVLRTCRGRSWNTERSRSLSDR